MKTLSIVFATVMTTSLAGAAHAARPADEIRQQVVSFADLDLDQDAGAGKLYRRIRAASREVCETSGVLELVMGPRSRQCVEDATARAVADVNAPSLTRYHAARGATTYYADATPDGSRSKRW